MVEGRRRQGAGLGQATRSTPPTSPPSCCRRRPRRRRSIGLANAGGDTINSIKQAAEFGIVKGGQKLAGLLVFITDIHALGLETAQGLLLTESFYWDQDDRDPRLVQAVRRRRRRQDAHHGAGGRLRRRAPLPEGGRRPLKSDADGKAVVDEMKKMPTDDPLFGKGTIREDGRKIHPMYLYEVKKPSESKGPWDYYKLVAEVPGRRGVPPAGRGRLPAGQEALTARPTAQAHVDAICRHSRPGPVRPAPDRADQRLVLRAALAGPGDHLRPPEHRQLLPRRPLHAGRVRGLDPAGEGGHRLLAGADPRAAGCRRSSASLHRADYAAAGSYRLDPLYGLLLTFGLALILQGVFRNYFGSSGLPYEMPAQLQGGKTLRLHVPAQLPRLGDRRLADRLPRHLGVIEGTRLGSWLRAATENAPLVSAFGINVPRMITLTYGCGVALAALAGVLAAPIYRVGPLMGANLIIVVFAVVVIGGMGSILGSIITGFALGILEGLTKVFYPEASNTVIFVVMAIVLLVRPAGLFGKQA